jgi:hypothetical protein
MIEEVKSGVFGIFYPSSGIEGKIKEENKFTVELGSRRNFFFARRLWFFGKAKKDMPLKIRDGLELSIVIKLKIFFLEIRHGRAAAIHDINLDQLESDTHFIFQDILVCLFL